MKKTYTPSGRVPSIITTPQLAQPTEQDEHHSTFKWLDDSPKSPVSTRVVTYLNSINEYALHIGVTSKQLMNSTEPGICQQHKQEAIRRALIACNNKLQRTADSHDSSRM